MKPATRLQHGLTVLLSISAAVLLLMAALPHRHEHLIASHPSKSCSLCKLHDGFSATFTPRVQLGALAWVILGVASVPQTPRLAASFIPSAPPRAPPVHV